MVHIEKQLLYCEHSVRMPCYQDPTTHSCREKCGVTFSCCSRSCSATCGTFQQLNSDPGETQLQPGPISRIQHPKHPCDRVHFCGHTCKDECKAGHICSGLCEDRCRQICIHAKCIWPCSAACKPCMRPCTWSCEHIRCLSLCGMVSQIFSSEFRLPLFIIWCNF